MKLDKFAFLRGGAIFALLCVVALTPNALFAENTTNTYEKVANAESISWASAGLPDTVKNTAGSDISIKIDYAEGFEKYQRLETPALPLYLDSVIGGKYHNFYLTSGTKKYVSVNDPTPFEGFWMMKDSNGLRASGLYLTDNGVAGGRTIGSAYLKGRFQFGIATGCEDCLDYPFGYGAFEVNRTLNSVGGSGKLTINRSPGPYSIAQVRAGTLGLVGGEDDVSSPVPGAWARFDASVTDSLTFDGDAITAWRDADGKEITASKTGNSSPTLHTDPETGLKSVNFGAYVNYSGTTAGNKTLHGTGSRLALSETRNDVAEMFIVFRDNDATSTWPTFAGDAFPRYATAGRLFKDWKNLPAELAMGEIRLDGQAVIPDHIYDFSRRMNVVSASYRSGGGTVGFLASPDNDTHNNYTKGGLKIAEIILYTNTLTAAERRHNNVYLMKKWRGAGIRDYGAILLAKSASLSVESGTARVRELQLATNGFVKVGAGDLEIESLNTNLNNLVVNGGTVRFVNTLERSANPQPASDPAAWFDATDSTAFDTVVSNYNGVTTTFVTDWRDKRNNGYALRSPAGYSVYDKTIFANTNDYDQAAWPTLDTTTGPLPMVDLGPWMNPSANKGHFGWIYGDSGLSTWLRLYKDGSYYTARTCRQGFVVFYKTHQDGNPINSDEWDLRNGGSTYPRNCFLVEDWAGNAAIGGHWTYDGATVNPADVKMPADGKTHLGAFQIADGAAKATVFGSDLNGGNSAGGCKIAEVILYDRVLTEQERLDTERYLMAKWNCGTHPADRTISSVGMLSLGDGVESVFDNDTDMTYGKLVREGDGAVVKKGDGAATVQLFDPTATDVTAVSVEGGSLSLWCDPLVDAWAHLDAMREDSVEYETVNGTNFVTRWKDISGHGNDATNPSPAVAPKQKPAYRTVHLDNDNIIADSGRAIPVVDFGEYYNYEQLPSEGRSAYPTNTASGLTFPDKYVWLQEFYVVHADTDYWLGDGGSHNNNYCGIFGYCGNGGPSGSQHPFLRASQSPVISDVGNYLTRKGYVGVNGAQENSDYGPTFKQLNVYTVSAAGQVSNKWCLAHRGNTQWGGQVLGEVILFQNANSEARRNAITAMLCNKWRAQNVDLVSSWTLGSVTVANDASLTVGGSKGFAYTATTLGGLGSIASGPNILGVGNFFAGTDGVAGTLTVDADVALADGVNFDIYVDAEGHVSNIEMTGKLTVGGAVLAKVHVPDDVRLAHGNYDVLTAAEITASGPVSLTLDSSEIKKAGARLVYDSSRNAIFLMVYPKALTIFVR